MKLSDVERKVLLYLRDESPEEGAAATMIGVAIWKHERSGRVIAVQGGGDYAAQMLLGRMRKRGLVCVLPTAGSSRWAATAIGRAALLPSLEPSNNRRHRT